MTPDEPRLLVQGSSSSSKRVKDCPLLISDTPLSFWGGIDPISGKIVDHHHPLHGHVVTDTIFCLPSGRGSCTASQVLLELIQRGIAPRAIVLRDPDGLVCVGAIVAQEVLGQTQGVPDIVCVGKEGFAKLLAEQQCWDAASVMESCAARATTAQLYSHKEQAVLDLATSAAERMAFKVMFQYAHILQEETAAKEEITYVPITSAHIDGCTYIGPSGLEFARRLVEAGGHVKVPTTLNSGSTDRRRWKELGVPSDYAHSAIALGDTYVELGCQPSFTCAPYLLDPKPRLHDNVAWGESNAVVFCNSVLGARTEKYADYLDICCALAGIVPAVGVHVHRHPSVILDATLLMRELGLESSTTPLGAEDESILFPVLGHLCGSLSDSGIPLLVGLESLTVSDDQLKAFCAAFGTTASSPLIHIAGITPEASDTKVVEKWRTSCETVKEMTLSQVRATFEQLDQDTASENIDLVALGNPHLSATECRDLATSVRQLYPLDKDEASSTRIIACMSRTVYDKQVDPLDIQTLRRFGVEFVFDTCWCMLLDAPIIPTARPPERNPTILTHSGKYAHYGPGLVQRPFRLGSYRDCLQAARTGQYARRRHQWLGQTARAMTTWVRRWK